MTEAIHHRGPDDDGFFVGDMVGIGQRRLSIIDLSTGKQPIFNEDGTVCVLYNGEMYNYKELRSFLQSKGHKFSTNTDTEVIVHMYEEVGDECVSRFFGMFAFALWDVRKQRLLVARDRVGIKPLYYAVTSKHLLFASEVKAILADGEVTANVDLSALQAFLTFYYTPGTQTLFNGIRKLEPGHYLTVENGCIDIKEYWDLRFTRNRYDQTLADCEAELTELVSTTVRDHMISDVPVGVLLSGGVDSTAMLSFATDHSDRQLSTFTIGFDAREITDERPFARLAARRYNSKHFDMTINASDFVDCLPKYAWHMDEPVCEPPAIALYFVSKLARDHVKVLLSGEGGDEAFAGYQTYRNLVWLERVKRLSGPASGLISRVLGMLPRVGPLGRLSKYAPHANAPLESFYYSRAADSWSYFNRTRSDLLSPEFQTASNNSEAMTFLAQCFSKTAGNSPLQKMLYIDTKTWLPDDLLIKADKMTMANSLELRVPLLDHRVLEFAASLPSRYKLNGFNMKYILKRVLAKRVPGEILTRKKTGFPVPYERWLREDCRDFVWSILTDRRTTQRGYFNQSVVEKLLKDNQQVGGYGHEVFSLLALELWHRSFVDSSNLAEMAQPSLGVGASL